MTHEELLAKIATPNEFIGVKYAPDWQSAALRAVVELHKPTPFTTPYCSGCYVENDLFKVAYPCPTIQAIEKELQ